MQELQCASPIAKGIHPQQLAARLQATLEHRATPVPTTAVFERLQQKAAEAERAARAHRRTALPLVVFASSLVQRLGIQHVLEGISDIPVQLMLYDDASASLESDAARLPIIVAPFSDAHLAVERACQRGWSLLLLAAGIREAVGHIAALQEQTAFPALGMLLADQQLLQQLPIALHALSRGTSYIDPLLCREYAPRPRWNDCRSQAVTAAHTAPDRVIDL
jgi:hypothetical protein